MTLLNNQERQEFSKIKEANAQSKISNVPMNKHEKMVMMKNIETKLILRRKRKEEELLEILMNK